MFLNLFTLFLFCFKFLLAFLAMSILGRDPYWCPRTVMAAHFNIFCSQSVLDLLSSCHLVLMYRAIAELLLLSLLGRGHIRGTAVMSIGIVCWKDISKIVWCCGTWVSSVCRLLRCLLWVCGIAAGIWPGLRCCVWFCRVMIQGIFWKCLPDKGHMYVSLSLAEFSLFLNLLGDPKHRWR